MRKGTLMVLDNNLLISALPNIKKLFNMKSLNKKKSELII